jgi:hypothetical protein
MIVVWCVQKPTGRLVGLRGHKEDARAVTSSAQLCNSP